MGKAASRYSLLDRRRKGRLLSIHSLVGAALTPAVPLSSVYVGIGRRRQADYPWRCILHPSEVSLCIKLARLGSIQGVALALLLQVVGRACA